VPVFKLADEHPLTKAGLRCVYVVEKAELGLRPGDIVFEFPFGRIVDTGMACRSQRPGSLLTPRWREKDSNPRSP
jgi:hypothetical protein